MERHDEPLPCPFCGSTDLMVGTMWVQCNDCDAGGPRTPCDSSLTAERVRLWNTRVVTPEPKGREPEPEEPFVSLFYKKEEW